MPRTSVSYLIRSREQSAEFAGFYSRQVDDLTGFFIRRVYDADLGLQLMAETFAQAFFSRGRFRGTTELEAKAWLYGIASRQLAMFFRRSKVEKKALRRLGVEAPGASDAEAELLMERAEIGQQRALVADAMRTLSQEQQQALGLRVVDELPYEEVADRLNISEPAARARVARGLKALAAVLGPSMTMKEERQ